MNIYALDEEDFRGKIDDTIIDKDEAYLTIVSFCDKLKEGASKIIGN